MLPFRLNIQMENRKQHLLASQTRRNTRNWTLDFKKKTEMMNPRHAFRRKTLLLRKGSFLEVITE